MTLSSRAARGAGAPRGDRGAVAVEFALLLPILLVIVFGVVDFGRAWNMQITLTQAAREGVRLAALGTGDPAQRTRDAAAPTVTSIGVAVTACPSPADPTRNARVDATKQFSYLTPISGILNIIGQPSLAAPLITGKGEMRCTG